MGSRTNFGIMSYRLGDISNTVTIMPSLSMKYFYPDQVKEAITGKNDIDFKSIFTNISGWEGDSVNKIAQEYLPTVVLLCDSDGDGYVINYITNDDADVFFRVFTFDQYKNVNIAELETLLNKERSEGISFEHPKEHIELIRDILPFYPFNYKDKKGQ